jgi:hypothetical protein
MNTQPTGRAKPGIRFTQEGNCFTPISDAAGLAKIADTWSDESAIGRLSQTCERWIYSTCLCFRLDLEEQERSGFRYPYSNFQVEYSRYVPGNRLLCARPEYVAAVASR